MAEKTEKAGKSASDKLLDDAFHVFDNYLRMCKMRRTPERYAVIRAIHRTQGIFTIDQIYNRLIGEMNFHISLATIYNTLELLEKSHLVLRHQANWKGDPRLVHYEKCFSQDIRHNFVCKECGNTFRFTDKSLMGAINRIKRSGFRPESYTLFVYGTCSRCHNRQVKAEKQQVKTTRKKQ